MNDDEAIRRLAGEITTYLAARPEAVDTAEGILRWWLPHLRIDATAENLERALRLLVDQGIVDRKELPDGRSVYGRSHGRAATPGASTGDGSAGVHE